MKIKICGITNFADALAAVENGAEMLGFNFYPKSARFIEPENARKIGEQMPKYVLKVGVFVNESLDSVLKIARAVRLDIVQLHGDETPHFASKITDVPVIKALRVGNGFQPTRAAEYQTAILLDAFDPNERGGTGKVFDWRIALETKKVVPELILAGGLSPENVSEAIKMVAPSAVDVCSSIESQPGKKDLRKMREFILSARKASKKL
jgi:phosphoribosylanthranilate isomerase